MPAPGELQFNPFQLWKHPFQAWPGGAGDVLGHAAQVGAAAAEQQPVVWRAAEIIEHELVVGDTDIAR
ncbi:hypothetical protein D3C76_1415060 [compost metagenome]